MKISKQHIIILLLASLWSISCGQLDKDNYRILRKKMVDEQVIARGITDTTVINTMLKVQRHLFVPRNSQHFAYGDYPMRQVEFVAESLEVIRTAIEQDQWQQLEDGLKEHTLNYQRKVVHFQDRFQF